LFLVAAIAVAGGCSHDSGGDPDQSMSMTLEQFQAALEETLCGDETARCCPMYAAQYSRTSCQDTVRDFIETRMLLVTQVTTQPTATFNPGIAADCLSVAQAAARVCATPLSGNVGSSCDSVFTGQTAVGERCSGDQSCAQPAGRSVVCEGDKCVARTTTHADPGRSGAPCITARDCGSEAECCIYGTCSQRVGEGEPCGGQCGSLAETPGNCAVGLACSHDRVCIPAVRPGESCYDASVTCEDGSGCYTASCPVLSVGGHTDWRLPSIIELVSIMDHGQTAPPS